MNVDADVILGSIIVDAIKEEMGVLREWYFYEPRHASFNALYYKYLNDIEDANLNLREKVQVSFRYFKEAIDFLNYFYPDTISLEEISAEQVNGKNAEKRKKRGRPKGSKNRAKAQ